ncbi:MAG TPA: DUF885 domain-containing protein [Kofleriaceae bacterium]|nr:DUF885 domain-containing protein [Kofleriaceae bacterium]
MPSARSATHGPGRLRLLPVLAATLGALACGGGGGGAGAGGPPAGGGGGAAPARASFGPAADAFYQRYLELSPTFAVSLGFHQYDGKLPDVSAKALGERAAWLERERAAFEAFPAGQLDAQAAIERDVVLNAIRSELFDLQVARWPMVNPRYYIEALELTDYISRDYAPLAQRARGVIGICNGAKAYLEAAQANLPEAMPRTWIDTALLQVNGMVDFAYKDVVEALATLDDSDLSTQVGEALLAYAAALTGFRDYLTAHVAKATDDFALGGERFARMLADKEGLSVDLARLAKVGEADLERNLAAIEKVARQIDPRRPVAKVVERAAQDKPAAGKVLAEATAQAGAMRKLIADAGLVTIPSEDVAEPRPSPPFMRWNFAFLNAPGVFEEKALPAFYYISPPDPKWPKKEQRDYIPARGDLLYTTVHEVWPGHFLHYLHRKRNPSRILRSFCTYSMVEGWAHYAEEMMHEAGASGRDPALAIGQLTNALLRDVRFVSAIGLHTRGMAVDESMALFEGKAFADRPTARQQAVRGTFDPGYLNYTLGKLMIMKLREDWKARAGREYSLKAFHDRLLSYGCAPLPVIRRAMLGPDAGPAL